MTDAAVVPGERTDDDILETVVVDVAVADLESIGLIVGMR